MSICDDELAGIFAAIADDFAWRCRALPDGRRVEITTSRTTANSESVVLLAVLHDGTLTVSDGGETINRLADADFDIADRVLGTLWSEALRTYRLHETEGRLFVQTPLSEAPYVLNRFADALVALDSLRLLGIPSSSRPKTLADEVSDYLAGLYRPENISKKPQIHLAGGVVISPALEVHTPQRPRVLVQPGAATSVTQSYDHAHTTMSLARRGGIPQQELLVVLGGTVASWNAHRLRALADLAFVGFWQERDSVKDFLDGDTPDDPLMVPIGSTVPMHP